MERTVVGIRDAKIHLSQLIKKVQSGGEVILADDESKTAGHLLGYFSRYVGAVQG
jgi:hypothetical protein